MKRNVFSLLCLFVLVASFGQENELASDILGSWKAYKETTLDGDDGSSITLSGEPFKVKLELVLYENRKVKRINWIEELDTTYSLKKDTLQISHFIYTIKKLTEDELVLKEEKLMGNLIYLHRDSEN